MPEAGDADRPHEASPKRIEDALGRGDTPNSREPALAGSLLAFALVATTMGERVALDLSAALAPLWRGAFGAASLDGEAAIALLREVAVAAGGALLAPLAILATGALAPALLQRPRVAATRIAPKASNLSPLKGARRLFGPGGLFEFAKSMAKIVVVGGIAMWFAWRGGAGAALVQSPAVAVAIALHERAGGVALLIAGCMVPIALVDLLWSRHRWRARLRMTHEEMTRETKDSDGDPAVRARRQSMRRDRARRARIASVDDAKLVVVNPTHVAVALAYDRTRHAAPVVVAKGRGHVALHIRERAEAAGVPLFREPPLARALERSVPLDAPIPEEFYALVAALVRELDAGAARRMPSGGTPE